MEDGDGARERGAEADTDSSRQAAQTVAELHKVKETAPVTVSSFLLQITDYRLQRRRPSSLIIWLLHWLVLLSDVDRHPPSFFWQVASIRSPLVRMSRHVST